ncbi:hypothetical protein F5Y16DRAFT_148792 [Xylariaceae sp. FL0255]|nr:hypothetical protein F5Y16DRAFT_148792 [Xylariaceae sp. FL0255]
MLSQKSLVLPVWLYYLVLAVAAAAAASNSSLPLSSRTIFEFEESGIWLENIAIRSNGDLLITQTIPNASLYTLKAPYSQNPELTLLHTLDSPIGFLGIAETSPDTFVIVSTGVVNITTPIPRTGALWEVSFHNDISMIRKFIDTPRILYPNGMTSPPGSLVVLEADCHGGAVIRSDTRTDASSIALRDTEMAPVANASLELGVNGVHYHDGYLYWSNSDLGSVFRTRFTDEGYPVAADGGVELVGKVNSTVIDDFILNDAGVCWVATETNEIVAIGKDGLVQVVAGSPNELTVAGTTAVAFGRTADDRKTLYAVAHDTEFFPRSNGFRQFAKVVAIDTSSYNIT